MESTIFKPRLKFKPPLKFFKFGHRSLPYLHGKLRLWSLASKSSKTWVKLGKWVINVFNGEDLFFKYYLALTAVGKRTILVPEELKNSFHLFFYKCYMRFKLNPAPWPPPSFTTYWFLKNGNSYSKANVFLKRQDIFVKIQNVKIQLFHMHE